MNRSFVVIAALVSGALMVPSAATAKVTQLRFVAINLSTTLVDVAPLQSAAGQPPSPGDLIILRYRDVSAGRTVGYTREVCTVTDYPNVICQATVSLRGGHIIVLDHFNAASRATQTFAITGGTGRYANATGEGAVRLLSQTRELLTATIIT
jgi:hypothetical protein